MTLSDILEGAREKAARAWWQKVRDQWTSESTRPWPWEKLSSFERDGYSAEVNAAIDAFLADLRAKGVKLVGREATSDMHQAGMLLRTMQDRAVEANLRTKDTSEVFAAMWDAAPEVPSE